MWWGKLSHTVIILLCTNSEIIKELIFDSNSLLSFSGDILLYTIILASHIF